MNWVGMTFFSAPGAVFRTNQPFRRVVSGRLLYNSETEVYPAVGDWVAVRRPENGDIALISAVLPRKSHFSRLMAGGRDRRSGGPVSEQVVAANIDVVFIVSALDDNRGFNLRLLERYLTLAWSSGA